MKYVTKYWPILLIILAFISGRYSAPDDSKAIEQRFEQERQKDREAIKNLLHENTLLNARMATREKEHKKDSTARADGLARQKSISAALKKENERINYKTYSNPQLDSIDAILFGAR